MKSAWNRGLAMGLFDIFRKNKTDDLTREVDAYNRQQGQAEPAYAAPAATAAGGVMRVEDVFTITGRGTVVTGQVGSGRIRTGDKVGIFRGGQLLSETTITGIEAFRKIIDSAETGDNVGILLRGLTRDHVAKGDEVRVLV